MIGYITLIVADGRNGDEIAVIGSARQSGAIHDLQTFGIFHPGGKAASHIHRHVIAANGHCIGVNKLAFGEDGNRRRAAAHIDAGRAHFSFVADQSGKTAGIRRCNDGFH